MIATREGKAGSNMYIITMTIREIKQKLCTRREGNRERKRGRERKGRGRGRQRHTLTICRSLAVPAIMAKRKMHCTMRQTRGMRNVK